MKDPSRVRLASLAIVASLVFTASAIPETPRSQAQTISVALRGADIAVVAASFARMTESELRIDEALRGEVDLKVLGVTWMTALDAACEAAGCSWSLSGSHPRVLELVARRQEAEPGPMGKPVSLDLEGAAIADVLRSFATIGGQEAVIGDDVTGEVTLTLSNVTVRTALRAVCESVGCFWRQAEGRMIFRAVPFEADSGGESGKRGPSERLEDRASMDLEGADLRIVLDSLGKILGCGVVLSEHLGGEVTISLQDAPARELLDAVCEQAGCSWALETDAFGGSKLVVE